MWSRSVAVPPSPCYVGRLISQYSDGKYVGNGAAVGVGNGGSDKNKSHYVC